MSFFSRLKSSSEVNGMWIFPFALPLFFAADYERTMGMMEAFAYLAGLRSRYTTLLRAFDEYLPLIEQAYAESCTCQEPF